MFDVNGCDVSICLVACGTQKKKRHSKYLVDEGQFVNVTNQ